MDQVLTAFILKVANSPLYALKKDVKTVSFAVNLLGYNQAKSLLMAYLTKSMYQKKGKKLIQSVLWKHAIASAIFGRNIAKYLKNVNMEEAFIACLLHDIGKSVLFEKKTAEFENAVELIFNEKVSSYDAELSTMEYTHVEVGYLLLRNWKIGTEIVESIVFHHNFQEYYGKSKTVAIVSIANKLSHIYGYSFIETPQEIFELKLLNISESKIAEIVTESKPEIDGYIEMAQ